MTRQLCYTPELDRIHIARASPNTVRGNTRFRFDKIVKSAPFYRQHLLILATLLHKIDDSSMNPANQNNHHIIIWLLTLGFITDCNLYILKCRSVWIFQSFKYSLLITLQNTSYRIIYLSLILIIAKLKTLKNS